MGDNEQLHESNPQLAFFTQKLTHVEGLLQEVVNSNQELLLNVRLMSQQMQHNDEKTRELVKICETQGVEIAKHTNTLNIHAFIWKVIGTGAIASFGVLSWGYATLQNLYKTDNETEKRLAIIEFVVNRDTNLKPQQNRGQ